MNKLAGTKLIHTAIWLFFNVVIFYMFYAIICDHVDKWVFICMAIIIAEGLVLLGFKGKCPLTLVARKYTDSTKDNFDIYLPNWLAKYNKIIYTTLFCLVIILLTWRLTRH